VAAHCVARHKQTFAALKGAGNGFDALGLFDLMASSVSFEVRAVCVLFGATGMLTLELADAVVLEHMTVVSVL
jgi:hypothetical protein